MHRPKSLFGRPPAKPEYGHDAESEEPEEESLYGDEDAALQSEDLEHTGMGSLSNISIKRENEGGAARPAPAAARPGASRHESTDPKNIAEYWTRLRKGRRWPTREDIDTKLVSMAWKNSLIMVVGEDGAPWRFEPLVPDIVRGGGASLAGSEIEFNHLVMEWMLSIGRNAESSGRPVEKSDVFPTEEGEVRYRALAVPLGEDESKVTHILGHVARV